MCWRRLRLIVAIHKTSYLSHLNSNYPYFSLLNGSPYEEFCCYVILDDPFISSRSNRDGRSRVFPVCEVVNHLASSFIWSPFCCFQQPHSSLIKQRLSHGPFLIAGTPTSGLRRVWLSLQHLPLDPVRYCRGPWKNLVLCGARILIFLERNAHQRLSHRPFLKARMALYPLREVILNLFAISQHVTLWLCLKCDWRATHSFAIVSYSVPAPYFASCLNQARYWPPVVGRSDEKSTSIPSCSIVAMSMPYVMSCLNGQECAVASSIFYLRKTSSSFASYLSCWYRSWSLSVKYWFPNKQQTLNRSD
jgi:hypothetical protein